MERIVGDTLLSCLTFQNNLGAVVVVFVLLLDFQLPVQSVPITTNVVGSNPTQARCARYNIM